MIKDIEKLKNGVLVGIYEGESFTSLYIKTESGTFALDIENGEVRVMEIE